MTWVKMGGREEKSGVENGEGQNSEKVRIRILEQEILRLYFLPIPKVVDKVHENLSGSQEIVKV